jgi:PAS domain S-box-containing protein
MRIELAEQRTLLDYLALLEAIGDAVTVIGRDYRIVWGNAAFYNLYGGIVGERCYKACRKRRGVCEGCPAAMVFKSGEVVRKRLLCYRNDGQEFWADATASPLRSPSGRIMAVVEVIRDATSRIDLEAALKDSETKYWIVADNTYDWEFWVSPSGEFLYSSPSCERITGYTVAEFEENPNLLASIVHPDDESAFTAHIHAPETKAAVEELEFRIIRRDGGERWIGHLCQPVFDSAGRFLGSRGSNRDITERKQSEEDMVNSNKGLRALNAVSEAVSQELDLDIILSNSVDTILEVMDLEAGAVFLVDDIGKQLVLRIQRGLSIDFVRYASVIGVADRVSGEVAKTGEPVLVANLGDDERVAGLVAKREGINSYLSVPLKSKGSIIGVMAVGARTQRKFTPDQVQLFTSIGNQMGVAIENARLFADLSRRVHELSSLHEVSAAVGGRLVLDELLELVLRKVVELTDAKVASISLLNPDAQSLAIVSTFGENAERFRGVQIPADGLHGWVTKMRQPAISPDLTSDQRSNFFVANRFDLKMAAIVPLEVKDQTIGCLSAFNKRGQEPFDSGDCRLLTTFAGQAAVAIENARLFEELSNKKSELEDKAHQLQLLLDRTFSAQEEERRRIATDIHDGIAQPILGALLQIQASNKYLRPEQKQVRDNIEIAKELLNESLVEMKSAIFDLRPPTLELGLLPALQSYLAVVQKSLGIACFLRSSGPARRLSPSVEIAVYRIVQEAMNNIGKHAQASKAYIFVEFERKSLRLIVRDDGSGFELGEGEGHSERHLGLVSMRERAQSVNGTVYLESFPGFGTRLILEVPLEEYQKSRA